MFLSRNYRLIVAPRKFDVLKKNICPWSEASRANMLVLRTSNFQGATIRPIVPRHKHSIVFIVHRQIFFRTLVQKSLLDFNWIISKILRRKPWKPNINLKTKTDKNPWGNSSEIKVTIDFRSNFVHWIFIIWELQFWNKKGGAHAHWGAPRH